MKLTNFISGLQLLKLYTDGEIGKMGGEHDEFHFYRLTRPMNEFDINRMEELDWVAKEPGDPKGGWMCFISG